MRQLSRDALPPNCLKHYRHGADPWQQLTPVERAEIWQKLDTMQGQRCAYCEAALRTSHKHIEHFRQRHRYPQGTFDWNNLFGSCDRQDSCGKHKDSAGAYEDGALIKPDVEDPEYFILFTPAGSVHARANLPAAERLRGEETIRIFNLNGPLQAIRRSTLFAYLETAEQLAQMAMVFGNDDVLPLLREELRAIEQLPHATAIKHVLTNQRVS